MIRGQLVKLTNIGVAVLLVSTDLDELIQLSTRVLVLYRGRVAGELSAGEAGEGRIGTLMVGGA
jgi:simple sugar transport system ATP-binding protein